MRSIRIKIGVALLLCSAFSFAADVWAQAQDTTPPQLVGASLSPTTVDVTGGAAPFTVTLRVTDDLAGVSYPCVYVASPTAVQQINGTCGVLTSGTDLDGTWEINLSIPQFSEAGTWTVTGVYLVDRVTNSQFLDSAALAALGVPTTFTVVSSPDMTPPWLTSFAVTPPSVDVSGGAVTVMVTMGLEDSPSGVQFNGNSQFEAVALISPSGKQTRYGYAFNTTLDSGTPQSGVWSVPITLPEHAEAGNWSVAYVILNDAAGNSRYVYSKAYCGNCAPTLEDFGFVPTFAVVSGTPDTAAPTLINLSRSPPFVNTASGPATIILNVSATDNLAGFEFAYLGFSSPSGHQSAYVFVLPSDLIAGSVLNGTYRGTLVLPQYSEGGDWKLNYVQLNDNVDNYRTFSVSEIAASGFLTDIVVILPSLTDDGSVGPSGGTIQDATFVARAALTLPPGAVSGPTTVSLDVFATPLHVPMPSGFSVAGTDFVNVQLLPEPAFPLPFPGATITLPTPNQMVPGTKLTLFKVDPLSATLIPEPSVFGGTVVGTVDPSGTSATFTGVAALSVVVGLVPSAALPGDVNGDGIVSCDDVAIIKAAFGTRRGQARFDSRADVNNNGVVDINDLAFVSRALPLRTVCH